MSTIYFVPTYLPPLLISQPPPQFSFSCWSNSTVVELIFAFTQHIILVKFLLVPFDDFHGSVHHRFFPVMQLATDAAGSNGP
jgi:hypothetical protein